MRETQEMRVQSLGGGGPLEEGMANHSSILAWRIPWAEEPGGLQSMGSRRVRHDSNWARTRACWHQDHGKKKKDVKQSPRLFQKTREVELQFRSFLTQNVFSSFLPPSLSFFFSFSFFLSFFFLVLQSTNFQWPRTPFSRMATFSKKARALLHIMWLVLVHIL